MSVRELRRDRPSFLFILSSPPPPSSFIGAIFRLVLDYPSSLFAPKLHGNACYAGYVFNCVEKCFAFSWRSGPEIGVPVDLCWINQAYRALSNCSSSASFRDFRFNPSLVSMLSVNFRILSLFFRMSEICCLLMPNSWAKFVPFSALSKREKIICLSLIDRTARFRFVDTFLIWVYDRSLVCLHNPGGRN